MLERAMKQQRQRQYDREERHGPPEGSALALQLRERTVDREVEQGPAVSRAHGQADRDLMQDPGEEERGGERGGPPEASGDGPVDRDRRHLREREVPAARPELAEALRAPG